MIGYRRICLIFFLGLIGFPATVLTQNTGDTTAFVLETGTVISRRYTPFWLFSNTFNTVTAKPFNLWLRGKIAGEKSIGDFFGVHYGIDIIDIYAGHNKAYLQQAYTGIKLGKISIKGGLWEQYYGNHDPVLSSGGLIWSGNARPLPRIVLDMEEYSHVPFTRGFIQFKGGIGHGWLGDNKLIKNAWLHHKYIYVQLGGKHDTHVEYGFHHFAQWGGTSTNPEFGTLPHDVKAFLKVLFGQGGGNAGPANEIVNAYGNHVGSHNLSVNIQGKIVSKSFYWQSIFEDRSGMRLKNFRDGLWGVNLKFKNNGIINKAVVEFINTTHQSGQMNIDSTHEGMGNDDYFNHSLYGGWIYRNMTIGTPLITSPALVNSAYIINNKVTTLHLGLEGALESVNYWILYTFSRNYATNSHPFSSVKNQHSILVRSTFNNLLPYGIKTTVAIGIDKGELLGNRAGIYFILRKEGFRNK